MSATIEVHDTLPRNGAKPSALRHDRPVINTQELMKRRSNALKLVRRVIVRWSVNQPFHPAIQSAAKTKWRGPDATLDTGRAGVANRINEICHFTSH